MTSFRIKGLCAAALAVSAALCCVVPSVASATAAATIWTIAGDGTACTTAPACADGNPATSAQLSFPEGIAGDAAGNVYIDDWGNSEVRKLSADGTISLIAGDGTPCPSAPSCGDGGPGPSAELNFPQAVAVDAAGNLYIADTGNNEVRKLSPRGVMTRIAGNGQVCSTAPACGDGGSAVRASLNAPGGVAVDRSGNVYVADTGDNEVRKITPRGIISRVAGLGAACATAPNCGDGGPATSARLNVPQGLALDSSGRLYIVDDGDHEVRRIVHGTITRFAGTGVGCATAPACGDGRAATNAQLNLPEGIAVDPSGNVFIADWGDDEIRAVSPRGIITTVAGKGLMCQSAPSCGDSGPAASASLTAPQGVAVDGAGDLVIADTEDNLLRLVTPASAKPASFTAPEGKVSLIALAASTSRSRVTVRYLLTRPVALTLSVRASGGQERVVARAGGHAGVGQLVWNRRLGGRLAPAGRYQLIVTASAGRARAQSAIAVRL